MSTPPTARQINDACSAGLFVFIGNRQQVLGATAYRNGELTIKGRLWIHRASDLAWEYVEASSVIITSETVGKRKDKQMPQGKRHGGRTPHLRPVKRTSKAKARSNNGNQELPGVSIDDRRIIEIEEAQELVETVSKRASAAIEKAHKNLKDAKDALVTQLHAHGFDAERNPVYTRQPWGSVVLQKKGEVKEEAKFTAGTAKPKKKAKDADSEDDDDEE